MVNDDPAQAYQRLHPKVQRWVWDQGWQRLRSVQAEAIGPVLAAGDVVIAAATASGKTEAAWLPIFSDLATDETAAQTGVRALYLGPLKALINDQALRLETLGEATDIPVHRWHGDIASSHKKKLTKQPDGVLLITPESLEALFVREGHRVPAIFQGLRAIVVDELHSFMGTERGAQLLSLMHRLDLAVRRRIPRIGLSATLADLSMAAEFLRPGSGGAVHLVNNPGGDTAEVRMQLRGYVKQRPKQADLEDKQDDEPVHSNDALAIGEHLFVNLRGRDNLVFANSRAFVEAYSDILARLSDIHRVPNEFLPHHGNLSKEYREDVEKRLRSTETPATAICTSTLEMGVDIGSTDSVAQIGAPSSVASLRQRLGRSGRRDQPAVLRLYASEAELTERTPPADQLRAQLFQTIAMVDLMLNESWYESPNPRDLHLSTLIQQTLSVIAQHGGARAADLYTTLCSQGPFQRVAKPMYLSLLRTLGEADLLVQSSEGLLLHGELGDRLVNHYTFYSAFTSAEEYRLVAQGRTLGSIPVDYPILVGSLIIFAGRRWQVISVDTQSRIIELTRSSGGRPPSFAGGGADVDDVVRRRMQTLYQSPEVPAYLDETARRLLEEGRNSYRRLDLEDAHFIDWGSDTLLFPWRGDQVLNTVAVALANEGLKVGLDGVAITVRDADQDSIRNVILELLSTGPPDPLELASTVQNSERQKYDRYLSPELLAASFAAHGLDVAGAWETLASIMPRTE